MPLIDPPEGPSQYVHTQHPPDKVYRDNSSGDVNYPVASGFRLSKIEHAAMVAGCAQLAISTDYTLHALRLARGGRILPADCYPPNVQTAPTLVPPDGTFWR
jgi:hypothetical protein